MFYDFILNWTQLCKKVLRQCHRSLAGSSKRAAKEAGHHAVLADPLSWDLFLNFSQTGTEITVERNAQWVSLEKRCGGLRICLIFIIIFRGWIHSTFLFHGEKTCSLLRSHQERIGSPCPAVHWRLPVQTRQTTWPVTAIHSQSQDSDHHYWKYLWKGLFVFFSDICLHISFLLLWKEQISPSDLYFVWPCYVHVFGQLHLAEGSTLISHGVFFPINCMTWF